MFENDNNSEGANNPQDNGQVIDSFSMFNEPVQVEDYDDGNIDVSDDFWSALEPQAEESAEAEQEPQQAPADAPEGEATEDDLSFDDPLFTEEEAKEEVKSDDDLKAELEKRGFKVVKEGEDQSDPNVQRTQEVSRLSSVIQDAKSFLSLPAEEIVREKVRSNLVREYQQSGRQGLINSEEFKLQEEEEYEQYAQNSALLNMYAENVKNEVQNVINASENQLKEITTKIEQETKKALTEKRTSLQNGIKSIHKSGIFGIKPTPEESKEIYNSIISGEFTKQVNSDPNLVAEFATFLKFRENITSKLGGPTYGEGVKTAVEAINGGPLKSETSLPSAVKNTANGITGSGGQNDRSKSWGAQYVNLDAADPEKTVVAGRGFL